MVQFTVFCPRANEIFFVLIALSVITVGCGNDDDDDSGNNGNGGNGGNDGNGGGGNTNIFSANINGESWTADTTSGLYQANALVITGSVGGGQPGTSISFTLINVPGPGTYPLIAPNSATLILRDNLDLFTTILVPQDAAEFNVTEINVQRVKGTFEFSAAFANQTEMVTSGNVNIPLNNDPF